MATEPNGAVDGGAHPQERDLDQQARVGDDDEHVRGNPAVQTWAYPEEDHKRVALRERKREQRQRLLHSMTKEERIAFVNGEGRQKEEQSERMQRVYTDGSGHVKLAIDLRYDSIMNDKELKSLTKQLKFVYGAIKVMATPFQLRLFHCSAPVRESLARFNAERWMVHWHNDEELTDVFTPESIVYLSPDSPNVLTTLEPTKTYVIGGIVDKSRRKGATLHTAEAAGVLTARLPIQEHITERLDHILNVNTVVDVLIHFHAHGDWGRALTEVLPVRKQHAVGRRAKKRQQQQQQQQQTGAPKTSQHGDDADDRQCGAANDDRLLSEAVTSLLLQIERDDSATAVSSAM